jgi:hypothetical protein
MEEYQAVIQAIALTMGVAWASGLNLYSAVGVLGGLWAALTHPVIFFAAFTIFMLLLCWLLPRIWRGVRRVFRTVGGWLGLVDASPVNLHEELQKLGDARILTAAEIQNARRRLSAA